MKPVAVVGVGAESALGSGRAAYDVGAVGEVPTTRIVEDPVLVAAGLKKPFLARARSASSPGVDPAAHLLRRAAESLAASLDATLPAWRNLRVAVVVGTSSGGMVSLTDALARRARGEPIPRSVARAATYFGPLASLHGALGVEPCELVEVLAACASSGVAIGLGCRLLELGHADLVVAGGYDAVSTFVAAGFECLGATSSTRPAPFRIHRDGMALGEAAVLLALVPAERTPPAVLGYVRGFGASCDAVHVTAPDRQGSGLARAALAALADAGLDGSAVDVVSAHGTSTPYNDTAEARALATVLGARVSEVAVHPFKAVVGHTLGASSALELMAVLDAMEHGIGPAAVGSGPLDVDAPVRLLDRNEAGTPHTCLKLSAAFGGANAALVASRDRGESSRVSLDPMGVTVVATGRPLRAADLEAFAGLTRLPPAQFSRLDSLSAAAVAAVASALDLVPDLCRERTGIVVGTATATIECNELFDRRLRERGAHAGEPRKFVPTTPNLAPGQCAIAFGLLGPSLSVGAGPEAPLEALLVAHDLLASGDSDAMLVVAAEDVGDVVGDLWAAAGWVPPADGAVATVLRRSAARPLDRRRLRDLLQEARRFGGRLNGAAAGWPALVEALSQLSAPEPPPPAAPPA